MLRQNAVLSAVSGGLLAVLLLRPAHAVQLITVQEAALPDGLPTRGSITRGPKIILVNPAATAALIRSPFNLRIRFESFGGTTIDVDSIVITYNKQPAIDLTHRMKPFIQPSGVTLDNAEVPPGEHRIRSW